MPSPGERVPPIAGQAPIGAGNTPLFALFSVPGEAADVLLHDYSDLLEPAPRPPFAKDGMWLVRPDGYVAAVAKADDPACIADFFDSLSF